MSKIMPTKICSILVDLGIPKKPDAAARQKFLDYLKLEEVQRAYLDYLLRVKYVCSNIMSASLTLQGKKLALFQQGDDKFINLCEDRSSQLVIYTNSLKLYI